MNAPIGTESRARRPMIVECRLVAEDSRRRRWMEIGRTSRARAGSKTRRKRTIGNRVLGPPIITASVVRMTPSIQSRGIRPRISRPARLLPRGSGHRCPSPRCPGSGLMHSLAFAINSSDNLACTDGGNIVPASFAGDRHAVRQNGSFRRSMSQTCADLRCPGCRPCRRRGRQHRVPSLRTPAHLASSSLGSNCGHDRRACHAVHRDLWRVVIIDSEVARHGGAG